MNSVPAILGMLSFDGPLYVTCPGRSLFKQVFRLNKRGKTVLNQCVFTYNHTCGNLTGAML